MDVAITHAVGAVVLGAVYANTLPRDAPYLASPLWVGIPPALVRAIAVAQVAALGGLIAWVVLVARGAAPDVAPALPTPAALQPGAAAGAELCRKLGRAGLSESACHSLSSSRVAAASMRCVVADATALVELQSGAGGPS